MKQQRLVWLVGVMGVLAVLRVLAPPTSRDVPLAVVEPIIRKPVATKVTTADAALPLPPAASVVLAAMTADDADVPGDAFAVRPPPPPPYVPPPPKLAQAKRPTPPPIVVPVATEPPPPPMPYQVIGTWDDGKEPGVFLSSPTGTLLARPGSTLQSEYKVTAITPQQITLLHLASKREVRLAVTRPAQTSFNLSPRPSP